MDLGLTGRVAVVSGSSRGIGLATALALGGEGCRVVVVARSADGVAEAAERVRATGAEVLPVVADMTVEDDVVRVVRSAGERFGRVDIAVSNVLGHVIDAAVEGAGPAAGRFAGMPAAEYAAEFAQLAVSAWLLARETVPLMRRAGWGRLVNVGSGVAREPKTDIPHVLPNTVRPVVAGLMRTLAARLAPDGITCNSVLTGGIATERNAAYFSWLARERGMPVADVLAGFTTDVPVRRMGEPAEIASLITFLCSARAGRLTGQSIPVDGGVNRHL